MNLVVDASVILKWLGANPATERDTQRASELMRTVLEGRVEILQPVHWLAEVSAVLARLSPKTAVNDVEMLHALELPVRDDAVVFRRAAQLAIELKQHVFDTLYHAIALETEGSVFITADERYVRAAAGLPNLLTLSAWDGS